MGATPPPLRSPGTRRRLRESPLLQPLTASRSLSPTNAQPTPTPTLKSPPTKKRLHLSKDTRRQWLLEALATLDTTSLSLQLQDELTTSPQHERSVDMTMIGDAPVVATSEELTSAALLASKDHGIVAQSSMLSPKRPPIAVKRSPSKTNQKRIPVHSPRGQLHTRRAIAPLLVSTEMLAKLQAHLEQKIRGDLWQNEVRSRLARPLSATVFSNRSEQLEHPLTAPQFVSSSSSLKPDHHCSRPLYPYSLQAHNWSDRMQRMYRKHCYRREILTAVRRLAIAIRFFRRVILPWLIKAHRRRRRAAVQIQRRVRWHFRWKRRVLHPFAVRFVASVIDHACRRVKARVVVRIKLQRLVQDRKAREIHARERRRVLFRWVAKTRVALFVHRRWCPQWFRCKRTGNLDTLRMECEQLEHSDAVVRVEYTTIFETVLGKKILKKELSAWRKSISLTRQPRPISTAAALAQPESASSDTGSSDDAAAVLRLRQCFQIFDLDGSGTLDLDEFELMLAHLRSSLAKNSSSSSTTTSTKEIKRAKLTTAQVRDLFESLDVDGSGTVTCDEFQAWWTSQHGTNMANGSDMATGSASVMLLSSGLDRLVLTGHGLLFWLLGKKQQLERKFVKKLLIKKAQDNAKRVLLEQLRRDQIHDHETRRCGQCARRFGLQRDLDDHAKYACRTSTTTTTTTTAANLPPWIVDTFVWRKWIREEELRLLEDEQDDAEDDQDGTASASSSISQVVMP